MSISTLGCSADWTVEWSALSLSADCSTGLLFPTPIISNLFADLPLADTLPDNLSSLSCSEEARARQLSNSRLAGADWERYFKVLVTGALDCVCMLSSEDMHALVFVATKCAANWSVSSSATG